MRGGIKFLLHVFLDCSRANYSFHGKFIFKMPNCDTIAGFTFLNTCLAGKRFLIFGAFATNIHINLYLFFRYTEAFHTILHKFLVFCVHWRKYFFFFGTMYFQIIATVTTPFRQLTNL